MMSRRLKHTVSWGLVGGVCVPKTIKGWGFLARETRGRPRIRRSIVWKRWWNGKSIRREGSAAQFWFGTFSHNGKQANLTRIALKRKRGHHSPGQINYGKGTNTQLFQMNVSLQAQMNYNPGWFLRSSIRLSRSDCARLISSPFIAGVTCLVDHFIALNKTYFDFRKEFDQDSHYIIVETVLTWRLDVTTVFGGFNICCVCGSTKWLVWILRFWSCT